MEPSSTIKIGAAFAAGVVVALGSALIYVKATDVQPRPPLQIPAAGPGAGSQPEAIETPPANSDTKPAAPPAGAAPVAEQAPVVTRAPLPASTPAAKTAESPRLKRVHPHHAATVAANGAIRVEVSQVTPSSADPLEPQPILQPAIREVNTVNQDQPSVTAPPEGIAAPQITPAQMTPPPAPQPHVVTLPAGTNLVVRLGETLSTDHNYSGDAFRGSLAEPIIMNGFIIADKGSKVLGQIVSADKAGKLEGSAALQLRLTEINTTDGQQVRIETGFVNKKGPGNGANEAAKIGGGAALGAIIGAIAGGGKGAAIGAGAGGAAGTGAVLLGHGKPAVIPTETRLSFQLSTPATITEKLN